MTDDGLRLAKQLPPRQCRWRTTMDAKTSRYPEIYARWQRDPAGFWGEAASAIDWIEKPKTVFDPQRRRLRPLVSRRRLQHLLQRGRPPCRSPAAATQPAIIYDSPVTGTKQTITYAALQTKTEIARRHPANRTSASARATASSSTCRWCRRRWSACWPARASARCIRWCSAASRRRSSPPASTTAKPKVILSASCGIEAARVVAYKPLLDDAIDLAKHKPDACLILQRPQLAVRADARPRPRLAEDLGRGAGRGRKNRARAACRSRATDPLYILYTSGTTGIPKGVVRDNGGHMVALKWSMKNLYGIEPGEAWWAASDIGWVVGHSYIVYAPLLHGCTTILYEGKPVGTPDAGAFWRVIAEHRRGRDVHRADRVPRHQEGRPRGQALRQIRPVEIPHAVPRRRARRSRHHRSGPSGC